jgi:hypothetical protein
MFPKSCFNNSKLILLKKFNIYQQRNIHDQLCYFNLYKIEPFKNKSIDNIYEVVHQIKCCSLLML